MGKNGRGIQIPLVNWDRVCEPLCYGGLGIRKLVLFNQALLGKWLWRYAMEKEALWHTIVELKYGDSWGGWCSISDHGPYGKSLWRYIKKAGLDSLKMCSIGWGMGLMSSFGSINGVERHL